LKLKINVKNTRFFVLHGKHTYCP